MKKTDKPIVVPAAFDPKARREVVQAQRNQTLAQLSQANQAAQSLAAQINWLDGQLAMLTEQIGDGPATTIARNRAERRRASKPPKG